MKFLDRFFKDGTDLGRRKFIRDASALAALTVVGVGIPLGSVEDNIRSQMIEGAVIGQTFYLSEGIVIDMPGVVFIDCVFIATEKMDTMVTVRSDDPIMIRCYINGNGLTNIGIRYDRPEIDYRIQF